MNQLKITILLCAMFSVGVLSGFTIYLYKYTEKQEKCIREVLHRDIDLKKYYGHRIDKEDIWVHAHAAVSERFQSCMFRRDK